MHKESTQQDHTRELPCVRTHAHTHTYTRITCKIFRHRLTFLIHSSSVPPSLPPSISLSLSFPLALAPSRSRARALSLSQCTAESLRLYHWMVPRMRPKHRANQALMSRRMARWTRLLTPGRLIEVLSVSVCLCLSGCLSLSLSLSLSLCVCLCMRVRLPCATSLSLSLSLSLFFSLSLSLSLYKTSGAIYIQVLRLCVYTDVACIRLHCMYTLTLHACIRLHCMHTLTLHACIC